MDFRVGHQIEGRFLLLSCLGQGGQGEVWKAEDLLYPGHLVALKKVRASPGRPAQLERARREAQHLASLSHPGLVRCHRLVEGLPGGDLLLVMELAEGRTLVEVIDDPCFSARHRMKLLQHVARALAALHEAGLVHRDLKPENIVVSERFWGAPDEPGRVKLIDLGIAVEIGNPTPLTQPDRVIGTPPYMAPELIAPALFGARGATPAADIFAWGILAWRLLLSAHPTRLPETASLAEFTAAYLDARRKPAWQPPTQSLLVSALLQDCVRLDPAARIQDGAQLLQRFHDPEPPAQPRPGIVQGQTAPPSPVASVPGAMLPTDTKEAPRSSPASFAAQSTPSQLSFATQSAASLIPPPPRSTPRAGPSRWRLPLTMLLGLMVLGPALLLLASWGPPASSTATAPTTSPEPKPIPTTQAPSGCPCDTTKTFKPCASKRSAAGTFACGQKIPPEAVWNLRLSYVRLNRKVPGVMHEVLQRHDPDAQVRFCVLSTDRGCGSFGTTLI
jgi:serine/threonine-protein kinase